MNYSPFFQIIKNPSKHYNLIYREEDREMNPFCVEEGIGLIPWSPLARGFLAGTAHRHSRQTGNVNTVAQQESHPQFGGRPAPTVNAMDAAERQPLVRASIRQPRVATSLRPTAGRHSQRLRSAGQSAIASPIAPSDL